MTQLYSFTAELQKVWDDFVATRPDAIKKLCERLKPSHLYKHKKTNQLVVINSFTEEDDGRITITVTIPRSLNGRIFPTKSVFGVDPDDLVDAVIPEGIVCRNVDDFEDLIYG